MAVKKISSDYQSENLRNLPQLKKELDELNSCTEEYYIALRKDEFKKSQEVEWEKWNNMKENFNEYSKKYDEIRRTHIFKLQETEHLLFDQYIAHKIYELVELETLQKEKILINKLALLNPKNIKLPDEPKTDLEPPNLIKGLESFKETVRSKVQALERAIEKLKAETAHNMAQSEYEPIILDSGYWLYQNTVYDVTERHSNEEKILLILEFADKERRKFERLKNKFSGEKSDEVKYERTRIPEEVRIAVWRRDQGRCANCGSRENLEYDHIVPVSKGGSNTARNIELLCQDCNRAKGNRIE